MADRCGKCDEWTKYVYPDVHAEISDEEMIKKLFPAYDPKQQRPLPLELQKTQGSSYCEHLNSISTLFRETLKRLNTHHTCDVY